MSIKDYQNALRRHAASPAHIRLLIWALGGFVDELGKEIAGPIKSALDRTDSTCSESVYKELGALLWHLSHLCNALGISLADALLPYIERLEGILSHEDSKLR